MSCPDCGRKLRVPDHLLGKNVKCPGCGQKFLAEAREEPEQETAPAPSRREAVTYKRAGDDAPKSRRRPAEQEDEDYPVSRRRRDDDDDVRDRPAASKADVRQGWERVRFGINLVIIAIWIGIGTGVAALSGWLLLVLFGVASFGSMMSSAGPGSGPMSQQQANQMAGQAAGAGVAIMVGGCAVGGLVILLLLAQLATRLTGLGFCMGVAATPKTQALKGLAIAVFSLAIANLVLPLGSTGASFALARTALGGCVGFSGQGLTAVLTLAEYICFFLFLRGVAVVMKKDGLAQNILIYMIAAPIYFAMVVIMAIVLPLVGAAAFLGVGMSSAGSNQPSQAMGNAAGAGAAMLVGGLVCGALIVLIGLALFIWYIILLYQVRGAVDGWLGRN